MTSWTTGAPGKSRINALSILFSCLLEGQDFFITEFTAQKSSKPTQSLRVAESAAVWSLHSYCASYFHVLPCTSFLLYHSHFLSNSTYVATSHSRTKAAPRLKHRCRGSSTRKKCHQQLQCNHPGRASGWTMLKYKDLKSFKVIPSHTQKALPSVPTCSLAGHSLAD